MSVADYLDWIERHSASRRRAPPEKRLERQPQEYDVAPSEPIEVREHDPASTTIVRRLRRFWTDKRG